MSTTLARRLRSSAVSRRLKRGLRRRLGFEVMEGRCLLSAVTFQFSPVSLPEVQDTTQVNLTSIIGGQRASSSPIVEGGFIDLRGAQSQSMNYGQSNHHVPAVFAGAGVGGAGSDLLTTDSTGTFSESITNPFTNLDTANVGNGLRPVVISPSIDLRVGMPRVNPGRALITNQDRGGPEGGIVQIEKILAGDERLDSDQIAVSIRVDDIADESSSRENSLAGGARLFSLPTDSDAARVPGSASDASTELAVSLDQPASGVIAPAKNNVITGELARAMVFELAGGEPAWIRPVVTSDKVKAVAPADSQDALRAEVPPLSSAAAHQASLRGSGSRIRLTGNQVEFRLPSDDWTGSIGVESLPVVSQHADTQRGPNRGGLAAFNVPDRAVAEVFEQFGGGEQPAVRSTFEDDSQTGPLVAGSVIALFMLERAAARYKSRAERQPLTVVAGPPRI
jgi:hypothetical protein